MLKTVFSVIGTMIISFFAGWFAHSAFGDVYVGRAEAIDGTTLQVGRSEFELMGITSPQSDTTLGQEAKDYLRFVMTDQFIWCRHEGDMNGERRVGQCYAGLENLNERMVAEGFARDCFATSDGEYADLEARAKNMGRGMWEDNRMPEAPATCDVAVVPDEGMPVEDSTEANDDEALDSDQESESIDVFDLPAVEESVLENGLDLDADIDSRDNVEPMTMPKDSEN